MMNKRLSLSTVAEYLDMLAVAGICLLLLVAFFLQFYLNEPPCPLCLLQRLGFLLTAAGFLLNIRFGLEPSHYMISLLGALYTAFVALRQVALHIVPGSGHYGGAIFGFHMYTWSFIVSALIILFTSIVLGFNRQYGDMTDKTRPLNWLGYFLFALVFLLAFANLIDVIAECGLGACPENPTGYPW
jgi:disulfide bond formation protein DsbB